LIFIELRLLLYMYGDCVSYRLTCLEAVSELFHDVENSYDVRYSGTTGLNNTRPIQWFRLVHPAMFHVKHYRINTDFDLFQLTMLCWFRGLLI